MSIISGLFPKELKKTKVIPIHKKNYKVEPGNYRPVSILSIISKIFERVVCEQLTDYPTCNNYLYELQSGFSTFILNRFMSNSSFGFHSKK